MDKEKFDEVIAIHERIKALTETRRDIEKCNLTFMRTYSNGTKLELTEWRVDPIKELLETHSKKIKQEIDEEISELERKIESI